jgi:hypothetical protein
MNFLLPLESRVSPRRRIVSSPSDDDGKSLIMSLIADTESAQRLPLPVLHQPLPLPSLPVKHCRQEENDEHCRQEENLP